MNVVTMGKRISIALLLAAACGSSEQDAGEPGMETGPCIEAQCLGGNLVCLSDLCVDPDATPGTGGSEGDDGSGGASDDTSGSGLTSVSVLFVVDNTSSMAEEQAALANAIASLTGPLTAAGLDLRIGVTTIDNGNPWCDGTSPEFGRLVASSCRARTGDFVFDGANPIDATEEACLAVCTESVLSLPVPWIEVVAGATNLPGGLELDTALRCLLPQGVNGCTFEQPLESTYRAVERAATPDEPQYGFVPDDALLAVIVMTDQVDCSYAFESIFLPDENRVFWSDPDSSAPTWGVCWNAGVACTGGPGTYEDCLPANRNVDGGPADPEDAAALKPISRYIDQLAARPSFFAAIVGVGPDGVAVYADGDTGFNADFGIGPGCESAAGTALPPVRIRAVAEALAPGERRLYSICDADLGPALGSIAEGILAAAQN